MPLISVQLYEEMKPLNSAKEIIQGKIDFVYCELHNTVEKYSGQEMVDNTRPILKAQQILERAKRYIQAQLDEKWNKEPQI